MRFASPDLPFPPEMTLKVKPRPGGGRVRDKFRVLHGLDGLRSRHRRLPPAALLSGPGRRLRSTEGAAAGFSNWRATAAPETEIRGQSSDSPTRGDTGGYGAGCRALESLAVLARGPGGNDAAASSPYRPLKIRGVSRKFASLRVVSRKCWISTFIEVSVT